MEPQIHKKENGLAPLLGWTSITSSLSESPNKFPENTLLTANPLKHHTMMNISGAKRNLEVPGTIPEVKFEDQDKDSFISSSRLSLDGEYDEDKPKIPDGGWGWVVVVSSLIISMIADGISFSFGLLYIEFLDEFETSKSVTSLIGSLFLAVPLLTGPVMSALVDRYGCRNMTIVGGVVSAFGFVLSSYVRSIGLMFVTFGLIAGLGLGLCYVTAVVSIAYWFDKKRTLAVGLGACGTGIGTFVYAPLTQYLISEFGWRGTVLLLAGTFLNMCVCGALMRDPAWIIKEQNRGSMGGRSIKNASSTVSVSGRSVSDGDFPGVDEIKQLLKSTDKPEYLLQSLVTSTESPKEICIPEDRYRSVVNLPTFIKQNEKVPLEVLEQLSANKRLYNVIVENYPSLLFCRSTSDKGLNKLSNDATAIVARVPVTMSMKLKKAKRISYNPNNNLIITPESSPEETESHEPLIPNDNKNHLLPLPSHFIAPPMRTDSLPGLRRHFSPPTHHYLKNIKLHKHSVMYRGAMLNIPRYRLRASSCPDIYKNSMTTLARENDEKWYADLLELVKSMFDFSLFCELHFLLMSLSSILLFTWLVVPYFYLAEHLTRHSYTESEASFILSVIGITNTIGMIGLGWAGDQPWLNITKTYSCCLILCGISCFGMMYFSDNYVMLIISAAAFGLFFSSNYSFTPAILVELISLEKFTTSYGLTLLCQGIGNLVGPPLAGLLFDITQTWEQSFWQAGIWIVMSGVLIAFIPYTENKRWLGSKPRDSCSEKTSVA